MVKQAASLILLSLLVVALGFASSSNIHAQELTEFSDTVWIYYEDERPNSLDAMLWRKNLCLEALMKLNPDMDFGNVVYGTQLLLPVSEPCYYSGNNHYMSYPPESRLKYYENGAWLVEPYYSDDFVYSRGESVEEIAEELNVCLEDLLADNILLQNFKAYKAFSTWTSFDVFIPQDAELCKPPTTKPSFVELPVRGYQFEPLQIVQQYNICHEEILSLDYDLTPSQPTTIGYIVTILQPVQPCYNDKGQRLIYYDEFGERLDEPYYSMLPVRKINPYATLEAIANRLNVCPFDLQAINGFPAFPYLYEIEIFVPTSRSCPEDVEVKLIEVNYYRDLASFSYELNVCPAQLLALNPQFEELPNYYGNYWNISLSPRKYIHSHAILLMPKNAKPCYWHYTSEVAERLLDLEQVLNVCYEEFSRITDYVYPLHVPLYIPNDAQPCYNEQGQRLIYPANYTTDMRVRLAHPTLEYSPLRIHRFAESDNVYSISKQYNVCVRDLLNLNPVLKEAMPVNFPTFIPDTRPCYDTATGMPIIYEDREGEPLSTPQVADQLMYYGSQSWERVSRYYNVCINRIQDANQAKIDKEVSYLGWIIPTDRPPCYNDDGMMIDYACYDQPVDFSVDYSKVDEPLRLNSDGTHCYEIGQPRSIVWHNNQPNLLMSYNGTMLESRAFTAWCYGVSLEDINAINDDPQVLAMLPLKTRLIPQPTRECYLENPELVDATHTVHVVQRGDTLNSIARQYDKFGFWIASTNQLDAQNTIWEGQVLVIPDGITMTQTAVMGGGVVCLGAFVVWRKRRAKGKRKRKNGE